MQQLWTQADRNNDGRLNLEEFKAFTASMKQDAKINMEWWEEDDENVESDYAILCETEQAEDKETKGITVFTLMVVM